MTQLDPDVQNIIDRLVTSEMAQKALKEVQRRSFSGRHPELGKMISCPCGTRHRAPRCEQKVLTPTKPPGKKPPVLLLRSVTRKGSTVVSSKVPSTPPNPERQTKGAAFFAKKRLNKHPSKKQFQLIHLVRSLLFDDATPEDVADAKELAKEILGWNKKNMYGTWIPKQRTNTKSTKLSTDSLAVDATSAVLEKS